MESKFEDLEINENEVIEISTTRRIECNWNNKEFILHHQETTSHHKFYWMMGEDKFNEDERNEIEEYLYSETEFYLPTAEVDEELID